MAHKSRPTARAAARVFVLSLVWSAAPVVADLTVSINYVTRADEAHIPLTLLEPVVEDLGIQGARLGLQDNQTTGQFLDQDYELREVIVPQDASLANAMDGVFRDGPALVVADLTADDLLALSDLPAAQGSLILNARSRQDQLRHTDCRQNVLHVAASNAMLADGLAQFLRRKRWSRVFLVLGREAEDRRYARALKRSFARLRLRVVEEKTWTFDPANRRDDSGVAIAYEEVHGFTQVRDYDVLVVADAADQFGEYLAHRTARPRPVAGTQGLVPTLWSRVHEQWGGTQLQGRFTDLAGRFMTSRDYTNWLAVRALGEAVTRTGTADPARLQQYILSEEFELQGFKGLALTFRPWNQQLRHRVLLAGPRMLVSVSPQPGFLHERTELDTLGYDRPDSRCRLN